MGQKLRQRRQAKGHRVAHVILLGGDGQFLHVLDGLKVVRREFETAEDLLVVWVSLEAQRHLVPEALILERANFLLTAIEKIGLGRCRCL